MDNMASFLPRSQLPDIAIDNREVSSQYDNAAM